MIGTKKSVGKKDQSNQKSVATAGGHRRKSQSMWCWMKVTKEGFLAQDGPGASHKDGEALWAEEQDGDGCSRTAGPGAAIILAIAFAYLSFPPQESVPKGLATAKQRLGRILKIHRNGKLLL